LAFCKIDSEFHPDKNCWTSNPHLIVTTPFNELYNTDGGGLDSSKYMWMVIFNCEPADGDNKFFSMGKAHREAMLTETWFKDFDFTNEHYIKCLKAYPENCLTSAGRDLLHHKLRLEKRRLFLDSQDYSLDTVGVENGRAFTIPGTTKQLTAEEKNTLILLKNLKELEEIYGKEKDDTEVWGGREETASEKGLI